MPDSLPLSGPDRVPCLGIVIPTYNRAAHLWQCLEHLEAQTLQDFEVVIVDDGSTDGTAQAVANFRQRKSFPIKYLQQSNRGSARARNRAITELSAAVCLMIGDDIFCAPDLARLHLEFHLQHPEESSAALGLTLWSRFGQKITPYMKWIGMSGVQFAYDDLLAGEEPSWKHFYTSNLSVKTACLRRYPFDEGFERYGMEDIELGYRLTKNHSLELSFLPDAIAEHLHPTTFRQGCQRARAVGAAEFKFGELWPEQRPAAPRGSRRFLFVIASEQRFVLPFLTAAADLVSRLWCKNPLVRGVLHCHRKIGYQRAAAGSSTTYNSLDREFKFRKPENDQE